MKFEEAFKDELEKLSTHRGLISALFPVKEGPPRPKTTRGGVIKRFTAHTKRMGEEAVRYPEGSEGRSARIASGKDVKKRIKELLEDPEAVKKYQHPLER